MSYGNPDHLRRLAKARAVMELIAASDEDIDAVRSILCCDEESERLAGITGGQRAGLIDVMDAFMDTGHAALAAEEISKIIYANHGESIVSKNAATVDVLETLRCIDRLTKWISKGVPVDMSVLRIDPRKEDINHPRTKAARDSVFQLLKIRHVANALRTILIPPEQLDFEAEVERAALEDAVWAAAE